MKIKTKLLLEVFVLFLLIGTISLISIVNTKQVQETFSSISTETLPVLNTLKDMRFASTQISAVTMEIILIEDETRNTVGSEYRELEEILETNFFKIEQAKSLFNQSFSEYSNIMIKKYSKDIDNTESLAEKWNEMIFISNKMIQLKTSGVEGLKILNLNKEFDSAYNKMNEEIDYAIESTTANIEQRQTYVESLVNEVTWSVVVALNVFIIIVLAIRLFILKSISKPLNEMRHVTASIAKGNYILYPEKGNDEISELGKDINIMSNDLKGLHKKIIEKERLSSIGSLATRLAHDIRNPLSIIKNSFEIIEIKMEGNLDKNLEGNLTRIQRAIERISHQTEDVLDFVNVTKLQYGLHSIEHIIRSTITNTIIPDKIEIDISKVDSIIPCDAYKLEIVFGNLINNACYAIPQGGEISFKVIDEEEHIIIEMQDSGKGIPEDIIEKIFDPLFTTKQIGTGLGLASCQSIIEAHEGKLSVKNNPTTFTIRLPKKPNNYQLPAKKEFAIRKEIVETN